MMFFFFMVVLPSWSTFFPSRRSSDLVRDEISPRREEALLEAVLRHQVGIDPSQLGPVLDLVAQHGLDRKSTRLNSSHGYTSYSGFCLTKKNFKRAWITI